MKTAICPSYLLSPALGDQILRLCRSIAWVGIVLLVSIALISSDRPANGQILGNLKDKLKDKLKTSGANLSISQLLEQQPITTSIDDVVLDVPFLDKHEPAYYRPITTLPSAPGGGWALRPGAYEYFAQSYCLRAGTHRPGRGTGYAYAPLKGPQAEVVRSILRNSARFPEIPQTDIQWLLWRIIARAKFNNLSMNEKKIAAELLSPEQLVLLNRSAVDLLPSDALNRTLVGAPPIARRALEADAQMREAFAAGNTTYDQLERIAILPDDPSVPSDRIPPERWSFNPQGYFVRYRPQSYSQTVIQIDVPRPIDISTDVQGRIVSISDAVDGRLLQIAYDDTWKRDPYSGAGGIRAYRFRSVHFERRDPAERGSLLRADWTDPAGALVGVPALSKPRSTPLDARYEFAREMTAATRRLLAAFPHQQETRDVELLANLVHLEVGLARMFTQWPQNERWKLSLLDLVTNAWQFTLCRLAGGAAVNQASTEWRGGSTASDIRDAGFELVTIRLGGKFTFFGGSPLAFAAQVPSGSGGSFDPTGGVAQPASDGAQRLGQSQRMHPSGMPCGQPGQPMCPCEDERDNYGYPCGVIERGGLPVGMMGANPPGPQFEADIWK